MLSMISWRAESALVPLSPRGCLVVTTEFELLDSSANQLITRLL